MIIDGKNAILGRLASHTAKKLLAGEEITIINAENIIITGRPLQIKSKYLKFKAIGSPQHGPFFPRQPNMIVRRCIRSMLPYKTPKGRLAFKKLKVYTGSQGLKGDTKQHDAQSAPPVYIKTIKTNYITVGEVAKTIGWNK